MIQTQIGNYRIIKKIGEGGMGVVYAAEHATLGRQAALKLLLPEHLADEQLTTRFINEAKAAAAIRHPGIVEVFDFGRHEGGGLFITMELLHGENLEQRKQRGVHIPLEQAVWFTIQACGVLDAAHRIGITHRDLKPSNIFIISDPQVPGGERVKLLDFGIAKFSVPGEGGVAMTRAGALMGTPNYMSPEQCLDSSKVDHRSDIYSMGCILYEMVCGRQPFAARSMFDVMTMQLKDMPTPPSQVVPTLPRQLDGVIERAMAKGRDQRYQSAGEFAMALQAATARNLDTGWLDASLGVNTSITTLGSAAGSVHGRARADSRWVIPLAAVVTIALGLGGFFLLQRDGDTPSEQSSAVAVDAAPPGPRLPPRPPIFTQLPTDDITSIPPAEADETLWIIRSEPPGAEVKYGEKIVGHTATPLCARWQKEPARAERLTLHLDEYLTYYHDWRTDLPFTDRIALQKPVTVQLTSKPRPGARVYVVAERRQDVEAYQDKELTYKGNTNLQLHHAEGETLTVVLKHDAYKSVQVDILFDRNRKQVVHMRRKVTVIVQTVPGDAAVWLDGQLIENPREGIPLAAQAKSRELLVKREGCADKKLRVPGNRDYSQLVKLTCVENE